MAFDNDTLNQNLGNTVQVEVGTNLNATQRAATGEFSENVTTTRTSPNTLSDMYLAEKWQHGDKLHGTFAKSSPAMKRHRQDINKAWGQDKNYKSVYINTLSDKKTTSQQLEDFKNE